VTTPPDPDDGLHLLDGVRVVDFTQALSGPYATLLLADLGADVTKVENPHRGDDSRHWGPPFVGADAAYFMAVNRNKRSVALDLKTPDGISAAHCLIEGADVVVENWRPGAADRLGLGAVALRAANPRLIYCSISGYGQDQGPQSGYDQIVQGTSGVMHLSGPPGEPTKMGLPMGDIATGMFAANAIVAALYRRTSTGQGATIDMAMQDSLVALLAHYAARYLATGEVPASDHNMHGSIVPYGTFRTGDGFITMGVGNDSQFARMAAALGRPDLAADPRYATNPLRLAHRDDLLAEIDATLMTMTCADVIASLEAVGVPVGPVRTIGDVLDDAQTAARRMVVTMARPDAPEIRVVNSPWKIDGVAPAARLAPPRLGEHTGELLG
jgi:crotonobetainyl-CoA:carnitine CoA-transferase CaiB-like acyl-CoA transferase